MNEPSVLEAEYIEAERPYSQKELKYMRDKNLRELCVGTTRASHKKCNHFYFVKHNGRKEKDIKEKKNEDIGNCSVCWKINRTYRHLKGRAKGLVDEYTDIFYKQPLFLTYDRVDTEFSFYKWLYEEFN